MNAQLAHESRPLRVRPPSPPSPDRGTGLLLSFVVGVSVMVADVVIIGAVGQSWILIPGFAVLLLTAALVFRMIMSLLHDGESPDAR